jgi:hypothetical protein
VRISSATFQWASGERTEAGLLPDVIINHGRRSIEQATENQHNH